MAKSKRVVARHWGSIDNGCLQSGFFDYPIDCFEQVCLDGDENDMELLIPSAADEVIIPNHVIDRKGKALLLLEGNNPLNFFLVHGRQFQKAYKNGLAGDGVVDISASNLQF